MAAETPLTIGLIGAGNIGGTLARLFSAAGHPVLVSNSRGPDTLADLAASLGERARGDRRGRRQGIGRGRRLGAAPGLPLRAGRRALPVAGDDARAKAVAADLIDGIGFDVVNAGPLAAERPAPARDHCLAPGRTGHGENPHPGYGRMFGDLEPLTIGAGFFAAHGRAAVAGADMTVVNADPAPRPGPTCPRRAGPSSASSSPTN